MAFNYSQLNWAHYFELSGFTDKQIAEKTEISEEKITSYRLENKVLNKEDADTIAKFLRLHFQDQKSKNEKEQKRLNFILVAFDIYEAQKG